MLPAIVPPLLQIPHCTEPPSQATAAAAAAAITSYWLPLAVLGAEMGQGGASEELRTGKESAGDLAGEGTAGMSADADVFSLPCLAILSGLQNTFVDRKSPKPWA
eukprot:CAMPEP_0115648808 /NCGR_PEP_ID=MMETSP0272-20121206/40168_1 /TAXON_ID=71861 /ORGANISM="Scrippsiella trochoidea, Strain CCMP3099" /LENGTH=104 /DNA_ID=CAMNT_0003086441 /DNA_START=334 /DNA_END=648 /DNA_ORIENTATION=-